MKTRTLLYTLSASVLMTLTSCNNWLDTGSSTQIRGDELLKTEAGFLDALTGIYINMSSSSMYGKNMTSYVVDMLAQPYTDFRSASNERSALMSGQYNDAQAVPFIESMWNNTYKTIASINNELKYVEANEDEVLSPFVQNMIKGELLALRAFLHLDLMRLYGYGDLQNMEDRETHPTIPYVTVYAKETTPQLTYPKTIELMIADLENAIKCLEIDPIRGKNEAPEAANKDGYWNNRVYHMNYFAAQATLARVYMWEGSAESLKKAFDIAEELTGLEGTAYKWVTASDLYGAGTPDRVFSKEHLFTLNVYNLKKIVNDEMIDFVYQPNALTNVIKWSRVAYDIFNAYSYDYDTGEYVPGYIGFDDYRFDMHFKETSKQSTAGGNTQDKYYMGYKLYQTDNGSTAAIDFRDMLPLIKISEMYYIMAEYYLSQSNEDKALEIINLIRSKRGLSQPLTKDQIENEFWMEVFDELTKEYMREFIGEGQLFYFFKRYNLENPINIYGNDNENNTFTSTRYLLPYPKDELEIGGRVQ